MISGGKKFGRQYRVTVDPADGLPPIVIELPFTVEFWIERNIASDLNILTLELFNLSEDNRRRIYQDRYNLDAIRTIIVEAGYSTLYQIFNGRIFYASSSREGVEIVTRIEARDGSFDVASTQTFETFQAGQTVGDLIRHLCGQFPNLKIGAIGNYDDVLTRPVALNGNTFDLLKTYSGGQVYIDDGKIYVLKNNEVVGGDEYMINDASGLLETPRREDSVLLVTLLMEAGVKINQMVKLQSSILPIYNGEYKVIGISHQGVISSAVSGRCVTRLTLLHPDLFKNFNQVTPAS